MDVTMKIVIQFVLFQSSNSYLKTSYCRHPSSDYGGV
jgi:hypothetical protein